MGILRIVQNQIIASHGSCFKDSLLQDYFNKKFWYKINPQYHDSLLTDIDKVTLALLLKIEDEIMHKFAESREIQRDKNEAKLMDSLFQIN